MCQLGPNATLSLSDVARWGSPVAIARARESISGHLPEICPLLIFPKAERNAARLKRELEPQWFGRECGDGNK